MTQKYDAFVPGSHEIESFGAGGFRFADMSHRGSILVVPSGISAWDVATPAEITPQSLQPILDEPRGTIELLLTLPMAQWQAVLGKFLAAWAFCAIALALTFPLVMTVNFLGRPDNGVIAAGYGACLLMAGAYLAIGSAMSAMTKNQVIAFVLAVAVCFLFAVAGSALVTDFLSQRIPVLAEVARALSLTERFNGLTRGVIALRDVVFFASFIGFWLFVNAVVLDHRKAD
jgi:ABC-2 type transport system permease protein